MTRRATAIYAAGPDSATDRYGDEYPVWSVFAGDDDGEPTGKIYTTFSIGAAEDLARKMGRDRNLPVEMELSPA